MKKKTLLLSLLGIGGAACVIVPAATIVSTTQFKSNISSSTPIENNGENSNNENNTNNNENNNNQNNGSSSNGGSNSNNDNNNQSNDNNDITVNLKTKEDRINYFIDLFNKSSASEKQKLTASLVSSKFVLADNYKGNGAEQYFVQDAVSSSDLPAINSISYDKATDKLIFQTEANQNFAKKYILFHDGNNWSYAKIDDVAKNNGFKFEISLNNKDFLIMNPNKTFNSFDEMLKNVSENQKNYALVMGKVKQNDGTLKTVITSSIYNLNNSQKLECSSATIQYFIADTVDHNTASAGYKFSWIQLTI